MEYSKKDEEIQSLPEKNAKGIFRCFRSPFARNAISDTLFQIIHLFLIMPTSHENEDEEAIPENTKSPEAEKEDIKNAPPKPPIIRPVSPFANAHQFKGGRSNNFGNKQRPGRAAGRGR